MSTVITSQPLPSEFSNIENAAALENELKEKKKREERLQNAKVNFSPVLLDEVNPKNESDVCCWPWLDRCTDSCCECIAECIQSCCDISGDGGICCDNSGDDGTCCVNSGDDGTCCVNSGDDGDGWGNSGDDGGDCWGTSGDDGGGDCGGANDD